MDFRKVFFFLHLVLIFIFAFCAFAVKANALSGKEWQAGRIIDDALFFDTNAMSVSAIQDFLNSKIGTGGYDSIPGQCDTNGVRNAQPYSNSTRAQYAASRGRPTKFTCLNNYYEVPKTNPSLGSPANNYGGKPIPIGAKSAAQLIWDAAQRYSINPKVLLVKIQNESAGPLTTDDWPFETQYTYALGAHCPDSGPNGSANCDSNYAGFSIQVNEAARLMRYYLDNMEKPWWPYKKPGNNHILWNVTASGCGGADVNIQSKATAALYTYTPYQPNRAALDNLYGTGDHCSAYGNRNFWRTFNNWFGSTMINCNLMMTNGNVYRLYNPNIGDYLYTTNSIEICKAEGLYGYAMDGMVFEPTSQSEGGMPIYRLSTPTGKHFYTSNLSEKNNLTQNAGFFYEGIAFYAKGVAATGFTPVYRMSPKKNSSHFYTASLAERNSILESYTNEGVIFYTKTNSEIDVPIYRLLSPSGGHFYTSSIAERDNAIHNLRYNNEGVAFTARSKSTAMTTPIYRLMSWPYHKFISSLGERATLLKRGYKNESIAFYAPTGGDKPIYRLYRHTDGDHLLTKSAYERDIAISQAGYTNEGITFYSY